jgi:hypothetical protein
MDTYIWDYSKVPRQLIRIIYNPYNEPASKVMREWILPGYWKDCKAFNHGRMQEGNKLIE